MDPSDVEVSEEDRDVALRWEDAPDSWAIGETAVEKPSGRQEDQYVLVPLSEGASDDGDGALQPRLDHAVSPAHSLSACSGEAHNMPGEDQGQQEASPSGSATDETISAPGALEDGGSDAAEDPVAAPRRI
jgi:hypothetical protein